MLHAVPPQNRHFQVMKSSHSVACARVLHFISVSPHLRLPQLLLASTQLLLPLLLQSLESDDCHTFECHTFIESACSKRRSKKQYGKSKQTTK